MTALNLTVNGRAVAAEVEPRLHLADFLREHLHLTGTHLGCEHGVCGACTLLLEGEPVRSCITLAAECAGRAVVSIEGLEHDPVMVRLRAAFSADHALQCGYCTPGMLMTARDIVRRLPQADAARIRLELAGNLCRCTGYAGIVRAIAAVLADPPPMEIAAARAVPVQHFAAAAPVAAAPVIGPATQMEQAIRLAVPRDAVWAALQDPRLIAACVPGATLTEATPGRIAGSLVASLGPIQARFEGDATIRYDAEYCGTIAGQGRDAISATRLSAEAVFAVAADGPGSIITFAIAYSLRGPLAQFGRGPVVRAFAAEIAAIVGRNLQARLTGQAAPPPAPMQAGRLALRVVWRWLVGLLSARR